MPKASDMLRKLALSFPETEEGVACEGTPLESRTVRAKKKAFLFLGQKDGMCQVRLKLDGSLSDAAKRAKKEPERVQVGAKGWVLLRLPADEAPRPTEKGFLEAWIRESYDVVVGVASELAAKRKSKAVKKPAKATR
jgi:hypothetical protein